MCCILKAWIKFMNNFGSRGEDQALIQRDLHCWCLLKKITCVVVSQKEQFFPFLSPPCLYFLLYGSESFFILTMVLVYKLNLTNIFVFCHLSKWNSSGWGQVSDPTISGQGPWIWEQRVCRVDKGTFITMLYLRWWSLEWSIQRMFPVSTFPLGGL